MRASLFFSLALVPLVGCASPAALNSVLAPTSTAGEPTVALAPAPAPASAAYGSPAPTAALAAPDEHEGLFSVRWRDNPWKGRLVDPITAPYWFESPLIHTSLRPVLIRHNFPSDSVFGSGELDVIALQARLAITERLSIIATKDGYYDLKPEGGGDTDGYADIAGGAKYAIIDDPEAGYLLTGGLVVELTNGSGDVLHGNGDGQLRPFVTGAWDEALGHADLDLMYALGLNYPLDDDAESTSFDFHLNATWAATDELRPMVEINGIRYISNGNATAANFEGVDVVNLGSNDVAGNTIITGAIGGRWLLNDSTSIGLAYESAISGREDIFDDRIMLDLVWKF